MHLIVFIGDNTASVADTNLSVQCFTYSAFFVYSKGFVQCMENIPLRSCLLSVPFLAAWFIYIWTPFFTHLNCVWVVHGVHGWPTKNIGAWHEMRWKEKFECRQTVSWSFTSSARLNFFDCYYWTRLCSV